MSTTTVEAGSQVTSSTALQIPPQPASTAPRPGTNRHHPALMVDPVRPGVPRGIINPKRGMDGSLEPQTPRPPRTCSSPGPTTRPCWSMDVKVAVVLVTVAGALILLLLYRLLQMRHRLKLARARNALQYYSFYHAAAYTFQDPGLPLTLPAKNGNVPEAIPTVQTTVTTATPIVITPLLPPSSLPSSPPPSLPLPPPPALPPPPLHGLHPPPPPLLLLPPTPPGPSLPLLQLPLIHTTPPSPHLSSWGASSDADVYSRIGVFRPSRRLSSLSGRTQVILFEHSSL